MALRQKSWAGASARPLKQESSQEPYRERFEYMYTPVGFFQNSVVQSYFYSFLLIVIPDFVAFVVVHRRYTFIHLFAQRV